MKASLNKKKERVNENIEEQLEDDSSDEEILIRSGNVPRKWYADKPHGGYDIKSEKVIKPPREDEIEKFIKQGEDKNWWRNVHDEMNNKTMLSVTKISK